MSFLKEIQRRRTFGIISHPDAGKTTLTEKLLLFGGAIQEAGAVKSNKIKKGATSDFMEIERQRGISVATSVLAFIYKDKKINILDTPGHKDFAEDTFRTLTAVDSVIVVIDVAKGVEEQTEKLVEVCRMRKIPIIVFINKMDREGKDAFDLLDEIEQKLGLTTVPLSFPIGMGYDFKGIYNIYEKKINLFSADNKQTVSTGVEFNDVSTPELDKIVGKKAADTLREELELVEEIYPAFDKNDYLNSKIQPVFFGSALNNFGVKELLDCFIEIAPSPQPKMAEEYFGQSIPADEHGFCKYVIGKYIENSTKIIDLRVFGIFGKYEDYAIRFISNAICKAIHDLPITIKQNRKFDYIDIDDLMPILEFFIERSGKNGASFGQKSCRVSI